jgi:uncharacterized protein (TIRG00374 family)
VLKKKHLFLLIKLAVGAGIVLLIASKLSLDDEIVVAGADGAADQVIKGRGLGITDASVGWKAGPESGQVAFDRTVILRKPDGKYVLETRTDHGLERRTADAIDFQRGDATLFDEKGERVSRPLRALKLKEEGTDPVRISPSFKYGLRTILGRLDDKPAYLVGAFLCMVLAYATAVLRWQLLLRTQGLIVSYWRALKLTMIGFFFNNALPGLTGGDIVKAVMIAQDHPEERPAAVGTVIVDRVLGLLVLALMSACVLAFTFDRYREAAIAVFGFLGLAAIGLVVLFSRRVRRAIRLDELAKRLPFAGIMKKLDRAFFLYRSQKRMILEAALLSVVSHCGNIGAVICFGLGIGLDRSQGLEGNPIVAYLATVPIIFIVSSVPVLPGGWGVGEAAFAYFFRTVGIWNLDLSIALSVIQRTATLLFSLIGGVFFFTYRKRVMDAVHETETAEATA